MSARPVEPSDQATAALVAGVAATLHEPFVALDAERRVVAASDAFHLRFGLDPATLVGRPLYDPDGGGWGGAPLRELLESLAAHREIVEDHLVMVPARDGGTAATLCTVRPLRRGVREIELYLLSFRDPPPGAAETSADALRRLADEHVTDLVSLYRRDGACLYAGAAAETVLGYTRDEWRGLRPCEVVHPKDQEALSAALAREGGSGAPWRLTLRVRSRSGDYLWMEVAARAIADPELGELIHASARDVTQRRRAEEAAQWLSRQVKLILDAAAEGIFGLDTQGAITFINPAAAHALGYTVADLLGQPHSAVLAPDEPSAGEIASTLRDGMARRVAKASFVRRDGAPVLVEYACSAARRQGEVVGGVVTFRDITERVAAEGALRRAERLAAMGQTVLTLRHEINNPLTTLIAEVSLLEIGGNSPEEEREAIASIAEEARRIRDVVRKLTEELGEAAASLPSSPSPL